MLIKFKFVKNILRSHYAKYLSGNKSYNMILKLHSIKYSRASNLQIISIEKFIYPTVFAALDDVTFFFECFFYHQSEQTLQ